MAGVLVDAGPLIALLNKRDRDHAACREAAAALEGRLCTVWPVLTEASHFLAAATSNGTDALFQMVESGSVGLLELAREDIPRIRRLMEKYGDLPMDLADAALVRAAEREGITTILTLDRRDFSVYRPSHVERFRLLP